MDIGHVRPIGFSKDNDKNTWIAYNKLRGQYMSALEHAIPERFFNDPTKCNAEGTTTPVLGLPVCPQGISAVKAIGIAASQGQKIYTITQTVYQNNPNIVNASLSAHSASTRQAVQNALAIGHEVTIHEAPITQSGWSGAGYTTIDPSTGAGGYMIEGGSNGGSLLGLALGLVAGIAIIVAGPLVAGLVGAIGLLIGVYQSITLGITDLLNFSAARLIGTMAGIVLAVIFGGYVVISFPTLFVLGIAWLLFTIARLFAMLIYDHMSYSPYYLHDERLIA